MTEPESSKAITEIVELARVPLKLFRATDGGVPFAVIPDKYKVEDLTKFLHNQFQPTPQRKTGTAKVHDAASFVEYVSLFRDPESRIFADRTASKFLAVLDYHQSAAGSPRWGQYRAELVLQKSREWALWGEKDGKQMDQTTFAQFIEDNQPDIVTPTPATMLEMARDLNAASEMVMETQQRQSNGSTVFRYNETVRGTIGKTETAVPESFVIGIPIYFGSPSIEIVARLRFRVHAGKLTFWYNLLRADVAEQNAFLAASDNIADKLAMTIINGTPA